MKTTLKVTLVLAGLAGLLWWSAVLLLNVTAQAQTRIALAMFNEAEPDGIDAEEIRLYLDGVGLRQFSMSIENGPRIRIGEARARVNLWPLLWGGDLDIRSVLLRDLQVDFSEVTDWTLGGLPSETPPDEAPWAKAPAPAMTEDPRPSSAPARTEPAKPAERVDFDGILATSQQQFIRVRIRHVEADATILLPEDQRFGARFALLNIAPGKEGTLRGAVDARVHALEWPVHEAGIDFEMRVAQAAQGGLARLEGTLGLWLTPLPPQTALVTASHAASGAPPPLAPASAPASVVAPEPIRFAATFTLQPTANGEAYRVEVARVGLARTLLNLQGQWDRTRQHAEGTLVLDLPASALADLPLPPALQPIGAEGRLAFAVTPAAPDHGGPAGDFTILGDFHLPAWVNRTDGVVVSRLSDGIAALDLTGRFSGDDGHLHGTVDLTQLMPTDHRGPAFGVHHQPALAWDGATLRNDGPVRLSTGGVESRGRLSWETDAAEPEPRPRFDLDRFDRTAWLPILNLFPDPEAFLIVVDD